VEGGRGKGESKEMMKGMVHNHGRRGVAWGRSFAWLLAYIVHFFLWAGRPFSCFCCLVSSFFFWLYLFPFPLFFYLFFLLCILYMPFFLALGGGGGGGGGGAIVFLLRFSFFFCLSFCARSYPGTRLGPPSSPSPHKTRIFYHSKKKKRKKRTKKEENLGAGSIPSPAPILHLRAGALGLRGYSSGCVWVGQLRWGGGGGGGGCLSGAAGSAYGLELINKKQSKPNNGANPNPWNKKQSPQTPPNQPHSTSKAII
jgi:hypothetical protein